MARKSNKIITRRIKNIRKIIERNRRKRIRQAFENLKSHLPFIYLEKLSKTSYYKILNLSLEYILSLEDSLLKSVNI